eukprot:TRINITY_DN11897_c0_g1_i1.p1 TRINITY_DN11897_c0_g1~~TRINITY_DN11897_c0_g1_i1.p1  ORF type:complete len:698 (+),score=59.03 TRINITY_DN11897_c0_g1_i1:1219-3312(+)
MYLIEPFVSLLLPLLLSLLGWCPRTVALTLPTGEGPALNVFVSPEGNDGNDGSFSRPLRTFEAARDFLRARQPLARGGAAITFREGTYLTHDILLNANDSGTAEAPIIYRAYKDERAVLIGGKRITNWHPTMTNPNVYQLNLQQMGIDDYDGLELFCNNKAMTVARYPNEGWLRIHSVPAGPQSNEFVYSDPRAKSWMAAPEPRLHGYFYYDWKDASLIIDRVRPRETVDDRDIPQGGLGIIVANTSKYGYTYGFRRNMRYFVDNVLTELDAPGEWYLDTREGIIYFWPPSHDISRLEVFVSLHRRLILLEHVSHVTFVNLHVQFYRDTAMEAVNCTSLRFANCTIANNRGYALKLTECPNSGIVDSEIYGSGEGGVVLMGGDRPSLTPSNMYAIGNHVTNISRNKRTFSPAFSLVGVGIHVRNNYISNIPHCAIEIAGNNHVVSGNHLTDISFECGDCGAVMASRSFTFLGNTISNNVFRNVWSPHTSEEGVRAVFLDDHVSGFSIIENVFDNCSDAVLIGGGRQNRVHHNRFYHCDTCVYFSQRGIMDECRMNGSFNEELKRLRFFEPPWSTHYPDLVKAWGRDDGFSCSPVLNSVVGNRCDRSCSRFINLSVRDLRNWDTEIDGNDRACDTFQKLVVFRSMLAVGLTVYVVLRVAAALARRIYLVLWHRAVLIAKRAMPVARAERVLREDEKAV